MNATRTTATRIAAMLGAALIVVACQDSAVAPSGPTIRAVAASEIVPAAGTVLGYVANFAASTVSVFSAPANQVVATIHVAGSPIDVAVTPDGAFAYVTLQGSSTVAGVAVVNTATNEVVRTIPGLFDPYDIAFSPDGAYAYVTNRTGVAVISTATKSVVAMVPVGSEPHGVAVAPDGSVVYVANSSSHDVSVISTVTNTVVATIAVNGRPEEIAFTPNGFLALVTSGGEVNVISTGSRSVLFVFKVGASAYGIAVSPDGRYVYVANSRSNTVSVYSLAADQVVATIPVLQRPVGIAITPDGALAYATASASGAASVINTATNTVVGNVPGLSNPMGIAIAQLTVPPRAHRPPPSGHFLGIAEKGFVETCNAYVGGFGPPATVRVVAQVLHGTTWRTLDDYSINLPEGACKDVWSNPVDANTRVLMIEQPITGFTPSCAVSQVGPGSTKLTKPCPNATTSLVFTNLNVGFLVEYTNH